MGISRIFDLSRRTLATYQRALDVTAHNIANSSNPYYSRQVAVLGTERPEMSAGFIWGTGVKLEEVRRVRDNLTDAQIRINLHKYSDNSKRSELLGQVENLFSEPSDLGLSNLVTKFFNSFNELSVTPNSVPLRQNVVNAAQQMSSKVKSIQDGISVIKSDSLNDVVSKVEDLNRNLKQIQLLNKEIFEATAVGQNANDLMDNRDALIDEISQIANITVSLDNSGSANISIGGVAASDLVSSTEFKAEVVNGRLSIVSKEGNSKVTLNGGELYALTDTYNTKIPEYASKIDSIMNKIVEVVNGAHSQGYTLTDPPRTNINFFEGYEDGLLKINEDIIDDPNLIAASLDGTSGNGDIALRIAGLVDQKVLNGATISESYSSLVSQIGNEVLTSQMTAESNELVLQQLDMQKASYSGVSVDEELTNMIKYQRSYDAAAKLIQVADEMLESLLNMV